MPTSYPAGVARKDEDGQMHDIPEKEPPTLYYSADNELSWNTMMRIAIAGTSGLAQIFAYNLNETVHQFILLSRHEQPELVSYGYQVVVVDYNSQEDLRFNLRGVDLVISTISGAPQINLIDAAAASGVRRFVPAEFEGSPACRPLHARDDPFDRGKAASIDRLRHWQDQDRCKMRFTLFICGVFYERFARGGLATVGVGTTNGFNYGGSYLLDIENNTAEIVTRTNRSGQDVPIYISLVSVHDVGKFVTAAVEQIGLESWPSELRMAGDRRSISEIVAWAEAIKGGTQFSIDRYQAGDLPTLLNHAVYNQDYGEINRLQELIATAQRRYDFENPNLNTLVNIGPRSFWDWLKSAWGAA